MAKYLSDLTPADMAEVTRLAGLFLTPREVAIMLEIDVKHMLASCDFEGNELYNSYHGGRLQTEVDLRTAVLKLAKSGSSPAQTMAFEMLQASTIKMIDR